MRLKERRIRKIATKLRKLREGDESVVIGSPTKSIDFLFSSSSGSKRQRKMDKKIQKALGYSIALTPDEIQTVAGALESVRLTPNNPALLAEIDTTLRGEVEKSLFYQESWRRALLSAPRPEPDYHQEAENVLRMLMTNSDCTEKRAKRICAEVKDLVKEHLQSAYHEDFQVRKRRISYARWVSQTSAPMERRAVSTCAIDR
jgi:hypothetical protein